VVNDMQHDGSCEESPGMHPYPWKLTDLLNSILRYILYIPISLLLYIFPHSTSNNVIPLWVSKL